ncbi:eukaryotic translation initiation factor 3 subunit M-like [Convolutriloba macropyga]|uniref:eukaryotic translation initiation factor 3 subunit M-like n=1 Tax=Convolutriloba macropyga TaxID=536237 RepID=UPI003F51E550
MSTNFIDCTEQEQAREIREFLKFLGAEIELTSNSSDVTDIVNNCNVVWKLDSATDIESVINSVVSLLLLLPEEILKPKIGEFCEVVVRDATESKKLNLCLKIFIVLFHALSEHSSLRYPVYMSMLTCAQRTGQLQMVVTDIVTLKLWRDFWKLTDENWQALLRLLHETLVTCSEGALAAKTMYELLSSYTGEKANEARDDSIRCVAAELKNPDVYLYDHLISLKPVDGLKGTKIYELLDIFVHKNLQDYQKFESQNKQFLEENAFDQADLIRKIRLLTFASIALESKELTFATLSDKLQLSNNDIESFIIEAIRSKVVKAKIDQVNQRVLVSSVAHRTFSQAEWKNLHSVLLSWRANIESVSKQISTISLDLNNPL